MKNKQDKHIKILAAQIVSIEKELQLGKDVQMNQQKIENIMSTLSLEDMFLIDDYIHRKKLLTK